ncbi:MAG: hypothetical protein K0U52_12755 [Gammaproteobacteria bacterium]|nr:hypothetical protein [Gammaproteobacteria bacterium]
MVEFPIEAVENVFERMEDVHGAGVDGAELAKQINEDLGLSEESGLSFEDGEWKMGDESVGDLLEEGPEKLKEFMESDSNFTKAEIDEMGKNLKDNEKFPDKETQQKAEDLGKPGIKKAQEEFGQDPGKSAETKSKFNDWLKRLAKVGLVAGVSYEMLNAIAQTKSGCFLVDKKSSDTTGLLVTASCNAQTCTCANTPQAHAGRQACSSKCPGPQYKCPQEPNDSQECVANAADICVPCGCPTGTNDWQLCRRKVDIWGVLGGILSKVGQFINEAADDVEKVVTSGVWILTHWWVILLILVGLAIIFIVVSALMNRNKRIQGGSHRQLEGISEFMEY